jgi:hypothetical protein
MADADTDPDADATAAGAKQSAADAATITQTLRYIYASHALVALGVRTWKFLVPIVLMTIAQVTLLPGALFLALQTVAMVLFCAPLGRKVDETPDRAKTALAFALVADISVILSLPPVMLLVFLGLTLDAGGGFVCTVLIMVLGAVEAVASAVVDVQIKKDWVVRALSRPPPPGAHRGRAC